jgi:hypothetical protein
LRAALTSLPPTYGSVPYLCADVGAIIGHAVHGALVEVLAPVRITLDGSVFFSL